MQTYAYLVLTYQAQARSSRVGNSASAVDGQQGFKNAFNAVTNEGYYISVDIER